MYSSRKLNGDLRKKFEEIQNKNELSWNQKNSKHHNFTNFEPKSTFTITKLNLAELIKSKLS